MFKKAFAAISLASFTTFIPTQADEQFKGIYFVGSVGLGQMTDIGIAQSKGGGRFNFDSGFSGDIGIGYDFGPLRTEVTYNSTSSNIKSIQGVNADLGLNINSFYFSGAIDFRSEKKWQPYISAGIGTSEISIDKAKTQGLANITVGNDTVSSLKGAIGVSYYSSDDLDVYGEVWVKSYEDFTIGAIKFLDGATSGATIGLRVKI